MTTSKGSRKSSTAKKKKDSRRSLVNDLHLAEARRRLLSLQEGGERHLALGLDLSLAGTGVVLWDARDERVVAHRRLSTTAASLNSVQRRPAKMMPSGKFRGDDEQRIEWIRARIEWLVRRWHRQIVVAGVEGHAFSKSTNNASGVHELHGVVKNLLHSFQIPFVVIAPSSLKLEATGDGWCSKVDMIAAAKPYFPKVWNDDEADALHLARAALRRM